MPTKAPSPCAIPGCPALVAGGGRCADHDRAHHASRNSHRPHLTGEWPRIRRQVLGTWVATHGWVCPGYQTEPHASMDLTVDHVVARDATELAVLCRPCNARKGAR